MKILKFGGSSLATPERIEGVVRIVLRDPTPSPLLNVVVSAMGGVTDALLEASRAAADGLELYREGIESLRRRHLEAVERLAPPSETKSLVARIEDRFGELGELLHGVLLVGECSARTRDLVLSYGERVSADVVASAFRRQGRPAESVDARELIVTDTSFGAARVSLEPTYRNIRERLSRASGLSIVTGFIGATPRGETTTLGRGGSDYTAALLGAALEAAAIELWTDVDGVLSADPRLVPAAFTLPELSYEELMELSHFGAKVVYPPTIHPARAGRIPLVIKNTFRPELPGTRIAPDARGGGEPVRGISSIHDVALLRLEGDGMLGVPGTARRLFDALAREGVNVILITQASSEHSICFAVSPADVERARASVEAEFELERRAGLVEDLVVERDLAVIAAVGGGMRERPGIAGKLFRVLGNEGVNVRAIAQGSSELNISLAIHRDDESRALVAIHESFFGAGRRTVRLFLVGPGGVGGALLSQLAARRTALHQVDLRLCGVANRRRMILSREGIDPETAKAALEGGESSDLARFASVIGSAPGDRVLVDCTASTEAPALYHELLSRGVAVVAANKIGFAGAMGLFRSLHGACPTPGRGLYYETTVGSALPVVSTLRRLVETGDSIERIEGVFSGTLGFVLGRLREGASFQDAVREAHEKGYTEPDPRDDLSGMDVARKLLILARTAGTHLEPDDVEVRSLLPEEGAGSLDSFWEWARRGGREVEERVRRARAAGEVLTYLARFEGGRASVGLETIPASHPAASLEGTDNVFVFTSRCHHDSPLVVRGKGAGTEVTASGVFADILQACDEMGR